MHEVKTLISWEKITKIFQNIICWIFYPACLASSIWFPFSTYSSSPSSTFPSSSSIHALFVASSLCAERKKAKINRMNLYQSLGKFSRWKTDDIVLIFPRKQDLTFHANCLHWRQFAWNVKSCFQEKIHRIFQCRLLNILPRVLSVNLVRSTSI